MGSDTEPVREVLQHDVNGFLCDFRSPETLAESAIALLQRVERHDPALEAIRCAARKTIRDHYDRHSLGPLHVKTLLDAYDQQRLNKNSS